MHVIDIISNTTARNTHRFSFELLPPLKGEGTEGVFQAIDTLREYNPAYIDVTLHRENIKETTLTDGSVERHVVRRRPGTVGISAAIKFRYGIDVVPHLICAGLSKYEIEDSLIDMDFLGLDTVLALRGDHLKTEAAFVPHPQGHAHATELVRQIAAMNRGEFIDGEDGVVHRSNFCIGVAGYPEKHGESATIDEDIKHLKEKIDAGADYIVTQMSFDNNRIFEFIDRCRKAGITVPIVPGIKPLSTIKQLTALPQIFWVHLPDELTRETAKCKDNAAIRQVGVEWAIKQSRELIKAGLPIIHYYSMGKTDNIANIVKNVF